MLGTLVIVISTGSTSAVSGSVIWFARLILRPWPFAPLWLEVQTALKRIYLDVDQLQAFAHDAFTSYHVPAYTAQYSMVLTPLTSDNTFLDGKLNPLHLWWSHTYN